MPGPDFTVSSVALFIGTPSPGKVLYIGTEKGCISIAVMIILLTLSCDILRLWRDAAEFQHHGQRESSRWKARSLSMVPERGSSSLQQSRRISAPADMCTLAPLPEFPLGRVHTFFFLFTSPCARITFSCGPQGPKKKKENRQLLQWFATQFMVLLKRRGK